MNDDAIRDFDRIEGLAGDGAPRQDRRFDGDAYSYVEGLVSEEARLHAIADDERRAHHHAELHAVQTELERLAALLSRRVHRRADPGSSADAV